MSFLDRIMNVAKVDDVDDYEDTNFYDEEVKPNYAAIKQQPNTNDYKSRYNSSITPLESRKSNTMQVKVIKPVNVDENSREIVDTLKSGCTILLNLEGLDIDIAQRIIDFSSGVCSALDGNFRKISTFIFLITPNTVGISGDLSDIITDTFDITGI